MMRIIDKQELANRIFQMDLQFIQDDNQQRKQWENPQPGQFLYIRVNNSNEPLLRRPISIHDYDKEEQIVKIVFRTEGEGTKSLSVKQKGDLLDVLGPLGNGFSFESLGKYKKVVLLGGGIGIPPLYYLAKQLVNNGVMVTTILGFQSKQDSFLINEFTKLCETRVTSMDGSIGIKGTVLDVVNVDDQWDTFYACGPSGMLKAVKENWINQPIDGYFSLEERMGCGIGACYGCIVKLEKTVNNQGYKKVCSDGPVFDFREVII